MSYEAFAALYRETFKTWNRYTPNQVGFETYATRLADLADAHPELLERLEAEEEEAAAGVAR